MTTETLHKRNTSLKSETPQAPAENPGTPQASAENPGTLQAPADNSDTQQTPAENLGAPQAHAENVDTPQASAENPGTLQAPADNSDTQQTLALRLAYRGPAFSGFARQPDRLTVQGQLEDALEMLFHRPIETTCAGRTDAGVHARGQVVSFDIFADELAQLDERDKTRQRFASLRRSLNAITHEDMMVQHIWQAECGFSARFDAKAREYRYFLAIDETPPVFMRDFAWHVGPLDVQAMHRASRCLIGEQDFKSFCRASSAVDKPTCRNVMEVSFSQEEIAGETLIVVRVIGSSFLHSMVRTIVGTLVEVGRKRRHEEWVAEALAARDRTAAGECAPACGLVFWEVVYE